MADCDNLPSGFERGTNVVLHLLLCALAAAPAPAPRPHRTRVVVVQTQDDTGGNEKIAQLLNTVLVTETAHRPNVEVVSASEVRNVLGLERQRQLLGCKEDSCLAELSGALGADLLLTSEVGRLGDRFRVDLRLVDGRKARVRASIGSFLRNDGNAIADALPTLVNQLLDQGGLEQAPPAAQVGAQPEASGPSRLPAYLTWGLAGALAVGATAATLATRSAFDDLHPGSPQTDVDREKNLAHAADLLWLGAAVSAGAGTWLYFRASPSEGGGGELGMGGRF